MAAGSGGHSAPVAEQAAAMASTSATRAALGPSWELDPDKPVFHVLPVEGWLNDPNGPIYYRGRYHIFYQHISGSSEWDWRMCWGHASSADLAHWRHEPVALAPTPGGWDAAGCWSGNVTVDEAGVPTMLYTGVRLRNRPDCGPLPPPALDLGLPNIETQCAAQAEPGDDLLVRWRKLEAPAILHPPPGLALTGWRDPHIFQRGGDRREWRLVLGAGIAGKHGTLLVYKSHTAFAGWEYVGELTEGPVPQDPQWDTGAMWECPFFIPLASQPHAAEGRSAEGHTDGAAAEAGLPPEQLSEDENQLYMLCVSPYPHHRTDRPTNPCLYWLGHYRGHRFQMADAQGPFLLDLGDALYAPNAFFDGRGRPLVLAWLQELRGPHAGSAFDYSGCLSLPRVIYLKEGRVHQEPAPELAALRRGRAWQPRGAAQLSPEHPFPIEGVQGAAVDLEVTLQRGSAAAAGVLLVSWQNGKAAGPPAAAIMVDWKESRLEVTWPGVQLAPDGSPTALDCDKVTKRIGGPVKLAPDGSVRLRLLADHSAVEAFLLDGGEALATRVYRGVPTGQPLACPSRLYLVAHGGDATARDIQAYEMGTIWTEPDDVPIGSVV